MKYILLVKLYFMNKAIIRIAISTTLLISPAGYQPNTKQCLSAYDRINRCNQQPS